MAKQSINLGSSANDGTGTTLRAGGDLVNDNFDELYTALGTGSALAITVSGASNGQALIYSSSNARFEPANQSGGLSDIVSDTSPQLGGNLDVNGQSIISASNNNIPITPNGSGKVILDGVDWPTSAGTNGYFLQTNGSDAASWATALTDIVGDTSPQLGGDLDSNSYNIAFDDAHGINDENGNEQIIFQTTSSAVNQFDITNAATGNGPTLSATGGDTNIDVNITPKGSGNLVTTNLTIDSLTMSGSGNVTFTAATTLALNANTGGTVVVNDGSNNADFRVESDNNANMLFVDAGSDHVNIGTNSDLGGVLNVSGTGVFQTDDNTDNLTLTSTDADAAVGPNLKLFRNSSSPAADDLLGAISFAGEDAGGNDTEYALIDTVIGATTDGSENGRIRMKIQKTGTLSSGLDINADEIIINDDSKDINFRVESDSSTHALFVDAAKDYVGLQDTLSGSDSISSSNYVQLMFGNSNINDSTGTNSALHLNQNAYQGTSNNNYFTVGSGSSWATQMLMTTGRIVFNNKSGGTADGSISWTELFRIANNGDLTAIDTTISSNSDERLKKDITNYNYDISKFKQFQPRTFNWKNPEEHGNKTNVRGFVAQELEAIDNYWVGETEIEYGPDKDLLDSDNISKTAKLGQKDAMYISVIQQLITRIEALEG